jgi:glucose/arabinose dehydrogenase
MMLALSVSANQQCKPIEAREPNGKGQQPASAAQTRACGVHSQVNFELQVVAGGLDEPWSVEPLPDGGALVTEKGGRMRVISPEGKLGPALGGVPPVDARGQGGLLDVALSPHFASDRTVFWSYSEPRQGGNGTSVARGVLDSDARALEQVKVILRTQPTYNNSMHFGSRLAFGPDGMLYVTMGERSETRMRSHAQRLDSHLGKVLRIRTDGSLASDNPFVGRPGALPEIWSLGHRNIQAAAFDAEGQLWIIEHGTRGGDELNLIEKGKNYGWPRAAYGIEYSGQPIRGATTAVAGTEQPVYYWDPVIGPSGAQFYSGAGFAEWRGSLFVGGLRERRLVRLVIKDNKVAGEEHLLAERGKRIRDVRQGPDGALYIVTDESNGELWKMSPRK